ncbi:MAG: PorP/SprF family type IX secretion system membrane protein [Flavobacteriales bacterium]|nr:PorP/SprF family type IX secretion system membrane protein [Flavobacteriales bacterium]
MKRTFLLFGTVLLLAVCSLAQDVHLSQFQNAPLLMNPASTGDFSGLIRGGVSFRDQWGVLGAGFTSYLMYADYRPGEDENTHTVPYSFGVVTARDKAGDLGFGNMTIKLSASKEVKLSARRKLCMGLQLGVIQSSIDLAGYQWGSQYDGQNWNSSFAGEIVTIPKVTSMDAGAGMIYTKSIGQSTLSAGDMRFISIGLAAHHLNRPKLAFDPLDMNRIPVRYSGHFQGVFGVENTLYSFQPMGLVQWQKGAMEAAAGCNLRIRLKEASRYTGLVKPSIFGFGLMYRYGDAICPTFLYDNQTISFYATYDFNISSLREVTHTYGAMEITLRYIIAGARRQ